MHHALIAATAALALLLPTLAAACGIPLRPSSTWVVEDDTPPCFTISGLEGREPPALDVLNACPEPVTLRGEAVNGHLRIVGRDGALQIEIEPGLSAEVLLASVAGEVVLEWSAGEESGRIVYRMDYDGGEPGPCESPTGCTAALGTPTPPGSGWMALGLVALLGLYRTRRGAAA